MLEEIMSIFTPRAQQVLALARKEAERLNHNCVGTEHLLLGLIKLGQGVAVNVLQKLGLDLDVIRQDVEKEVGTGPDQRIEAPIPFTPRVKKVLALAGKEAKMLNHPYVGTEHILLGLIREGDGVAARTLLGLGVELELTRIQILKELNPNFVPSPDTPQKPPAVTWSEEEQLVSCVRLLWPTFKVCGDDDVRTTVLSIVLRAIITSGDNEIVSGLFNVEMNLDWIKIIADIVGRLELTALIQGLFNESETGTLRDDALCAVLELVKGEVPKKVVVAKSTLEKFQPRVVTTPTQEKITPPESP